MSIDEKYLIIGSNGRLGNALLKKLIKEDASKVISVDKDKSSIKLSNHKHFVLDISKEKNLKKLFKELSKDSFKVTKIINLSYPKNKFYGKDFLELKEPSLRDNLYLLIGTNILIAKYALIYFLNLKLKGNLILTSSILGINAPKFKHYFGSNMNSPIEYSAAKSSVIMICKYLAKKYMKYGIRVNCISPGGIEDRQKMIFKKKYKASCGTKGLLEATDIIGTIEFLMSNKSKYINGQNIIIDDGWSL